MSHPVQLFTRALALALLATPLLAESADLVVNVSGIAAAPGEIGCALYAAPKGFPMDTTMASMQWLPADPKGVTCRFADITDGTYAVSVAHDMNGNHKVDTNFIGVPTEAWGVSRNARPLLRAPRFDEATVRVSNGQNLAIDIKVAN